MVQESPGRVASKSEGGDENDSAEWMEDER